MLLFSSVVKLLVLIIECLANFFSTVLTIKSIHFLATPRNAKGVVFHSHVSLHSAAACVYVVRMSSTTTSRLNTPSGSSSSRDPSSYSRSTPRSRTRSAAVQSFRRSGSQSNTPSRTPSSISGQARSFHGSQSNTPSRPTPSSISRQAHSFYGPGVHLEDVQREDTVQDHSASDTSDFEFGISRPRSENIEQSLSASHDREVSPEIPICEPVRVYGYQQEVKMK